MTLAFNITACNQAAQKNECLNCLTLYPINAVGRIRSNDDANDYATEAL